MAAISTIIAAASLALGVGAAVQGAEARSDARDAQRKIQKQQAADRASRAALERRAQIREERVRRARILQAAENTGTSGSSGEAGALSSLSTNLASNIGFNLGALQRGSDISIFAQDAADASGKANNADMLFGLSTQAYQASGGLSIFNSPNFQGGSLPVGNVIGTPQAGG